MVTTATSLSTTSASQPKLSAVGSAFVTGLAVLANPCILPDSPKTFVLDVQFYLGPTDEDRLFGSLRYFNSTDLSFDDAASLYVVYAKFARQEPKADLLVSTNLDYTFVGDLQWLIPLGPPGLRYLLPPDHEANDSEGRIDSYNFPTFSIDPCVRPYVQITGVAADCSKAEATFELNVEQYISCFKSYASTGSAGGGFKPVTTFVCHIPDSPKYKGGKPLPRNKCFVSLCGFITGVDRLGDGSEVEKFRVDVDNITFGGVYLQPAVASKNPQSSPAKKPDSAPAALFSYNRRVSQAPTPSKHSKGC